MMHWYRILQRRDELHLPDGVLGRPVFRRALLRVDADTARSTLAASALAQEAQLKMLRYQLNPHFLFNTLNAISTLILDNRNSVANSAVTGLSEFLRYTLDQDPMKKVTVAQEIDALNLYLNIEKMRFGERLTIEFRHRRSAPQHADAEPAVAAADRERHQVRGRRRASKAAGSASARTCTGGMLQLGVADDGPGLIDATRLANGRGVGIRNTRERLQVLYGDRGKVAVDNTEPGLRVSLTFRPNAPSRRVTMS